MKCMGWWVGSPETRVLEQCHHWSSMVSREAVARDTRAPAMGQWRVSSMAPLPPRATLTSADHELEQEGDESR